MEHSLNLGVGHILSHIIPMPTGKTHNAGNDNEDDNINDVLAGDVPSEDCASGVRKLLGLIKQVGSNPVIHRNHHIY